MTECGCDWAALLVDMVPAAVAGLVLAVILIVIVQWLSR
jgi:hypothetical protein